MKIHSTDLALKVISSVRVIRLKVAENSKGMVEKRIKPEMIPDETWSKNIQQKYSDRESGNKYLRQKKKGRLSEIKSAGMCVLELGTRVLHSSLSSGLFPHRSEWEPV